MGHELVSTFVVTRLVGPRFSCWLARKLGVSSVAEPPQVETMLYTETGVLEAMERLCEALDRVPCPTCGVSSGGRWHLSSCVHYAGPR